MKQKSEHGEAGNPLHENAVSENVKQKDENEGAGDPLDENAVFEDMKQKEAVTLSMKTPFLKI